jgi:hypothetical protein
MLVAAIGIFRLVLARVAMVATDSLRPFPSSAAELHGHRRNHTAIASWHDLVRKMKVRGDYEAH